MPKNRGPRWETWRKCDRCAFSFPLSQLQMQKGLLLDAKCVDNLDVEYRPKIIADVLSDTTEGSQDLEQIAHDPNALEF